MIDDLGQQEQLRVMPADRVAYWLPRVCLVLGIIGVLIWWWLS